MLLLEGSSGLLMVAFTPLPTSMRVIPAEREYGFNQACLGTRPRQGIRYSRPLLV